jgi:hypothetical protein
MSSKERNRRATSASWLAGAWTSLLLDDPGYVAAMREFQQRYPLVWSEDTGGRWAAAPARVTPGRAADT